MVRVIIIFAVSLLFLTAKAQTMQGDVFTACPRIESPPQLLAYYDSFVLMGIRQVAELSLSSSIAATDSSDGPEFTSNLGQILDSGLLFLNDLSSDGPNFFFHGWVAPTLSRPALQNVVGRKAG